MQIPSRRQGAGPASVPTGCIWQKANKSEATNGETRLFRRGGSTDSGKVGKQVARYLTGQATQGARKRGISCGA